MGTQEGINVPVWCIVGSQQKDRQDSQVLNNNIFCKRQVTTTQCNIGTEGYPNGALLKNYDDEYYSQGYSQIKEAFRALTKDDPLITFISDQDFISTNVIAAGESTNDIGYNLYVFNIQYQKIFETGHPLKKEFKFSEDVPAGKYGYALELTNKLVSTSSDGQKLFDLI